MGDFLYGFCVSGVSTHHALSEQLRDIHHCGSGEKMPITGFSECAQSIYSFCRKKKSRFSFLKEIKNFNAVCFT